MSKLGAAADGGREALTILKDFGIGAYEPVADYLLEQLLGEGNPFVAEQSIRPGLLLRFAQLVSKLVGSRGPPG
jgi:hypothetical protein